MKFAKRAFINTASHFGKTGVALLLSIVTTRWTYKALGQVDFGLLSVINTLLLLIVFLNGVMAGGSIRYFAFSIGGGNSCDTAEWFAASRRLHTILAIILMVLGILFGFFSIMCILNIPDEKRLELSIAFCFSLLGMTISMLSIPYAAIFTAHQRIAELSLMGLIQSLGNATTAFAASFAVKNAFMLVVIGNMISLVITQAAIIITGLALFPECKSKIPADWIKIRAIVKFGLLNIVGNLGWVARDYAIPFVVNLYRGATANAVLSLSSQVVSQVGQLAMSISNALNPELIKSEGERDISRAKKVALNSSKLSSIIAIALGVPLLLEVGYVFHKWLGEYPEAAVSVTRILILSLLVERATSGLSQAIIAKGRVAGFQIASGLILGSIVPLSVYLFSRGAEFESVMKFSFVIVFFASINRLIWSEILIRDIALAWVRNAFLPLVSIFSIALLGSLVPHVFLDQTLTRFIIVLVVSMFSVVMGYFFLGLHREERNGLLVFIGKCICKLYKSRDNK